jgi:hypothetical protein
MSVSVVIPAFNRAHRLPAAIDSVLQQRHADVEIIVVDDGSVDDTRSVVGRYGDAVTYVYQINAGVGAARNTGIRHATRNFIAFLDSDDRWHRFKLSAQLAMFERYPQIGLVFSDFEIEKPGSGSVAHGASLWAGGELSFPAMTAVTLTRPADGAGETWPADRIEGSVGAMYRQLLDELPILTSSVIVRRSALTSRTWYTERVALFEDWEFFAQVARNAEVGFLDVPTTVNVGHADPGRVSKCSALDRALSYQTLLERVWLADASFMEAHGAAAHSAYGRALLAVAREAVLDGRADLSRQALDAWKASSFGERQGWAAVYSLCSALPAGPVVLKNVLRGRALARYVTGSNKRTYGSVNPAA